MIGAGMAKRIPESMEPREANQEEVRRVAELGGAARFVLSVYLALDPPRAPTAELRRSELGSRLREAERRLRENERKLREHGVDGPEVEEALGGCLGRVRGELDDVPPPDHDVHALAVFCEAGGGELRAYWLRREPSAPIAAAFGESAAIEPLVEALPELRWAVALVSRKHGRVFTGSELGLVEVGDVDDGVHRWHAQGGWSQARYQRGIEKEEVDHVARVCDRLFALHQRRPIDGLAIGGPREIWPLVDKKLHPYLAERLAGHVEVDVQHSSARQVLEHVRPVMEEELARREDEAVARVKEGLGTGSKSVAGADDVLAALEQERVGTLLISRSAFDRRFERAVEAARGQSADIVIVEGEGLDSLGKVAALLRY
jgi:peptide chain release factor subunit 1